MSVCLSVIIRGPVHCLSLSGISRHCNRGGTAAYPSIDRWRPMWRCTLRPLVTTTEGDWWSQEGAGCNVSLPTSPPLTLVLQVGGGEFTPPPDPVFSPIHQNCLEFFGMLPWLFLDIYWLQNLQKNFPTYLLFPTKFWWETKETVDGEKIISSVSWVRHAADGKIWRVHPCFHVQSSHWV